MDEREENLVQENIAEEGKEKEIYTATGNYRQSEEMIQNRRGDRIAGGVIGALVGALLISVSSAYLSASIRWLFLSTGTRRLLPSLSFKGKP